MCQLARSLLVIVCVLANNSVVNHGTLEAANLVCQSYSIAVEELIEYFEQV